MRFGYWLGWLLHSKLFGTNFSIVDYAVMAGILLMTALALLPFGLAFMEIRHWLFTANWDGYSVRELTVEFLGPWPTLNAKGFSKILDWYGTWPGWLGLAIAEYGGALFLYWVHLADENEKLSS